MQQHYTAQELAGLPGMPSTVRAIQIRAKKDWHGQRREGTKAMEYAVTWLPAETRNALVAASIEKAPALPAVKTEVTLPAPALAGLAQWQRDCAEARLAFVREVQRLQSIIGKEKAVMELVARATTQALPAHLQQLVKTANAKAGETRSLSRRRLFDWCSLVEKNSAQSAVALLAPKARAVQEIPTWAPALLKAWGQPQKPALTDALEMLKAVLPVEQMPSYHQARRFLNERMGNVDVMRGRMGARELKNIQPFVRRDSTNMYPAHIYSADGHCFDAEVQHPAHGRAFRPEITSVIDVHTHKLVGWSCDLAESRWAVLDALRAACSHGIPALFYVDNGSGYVNDLMKREGTGLMARLGTTMTHSIAYNSQARGVIERGHKTIWVRAAKKLPTYMGRDMDKEARQKVFKLTRKDIAKTGSSRVLMQWPAFVQFVLDEAEAYNNRAHSSLPKITDSVTLKTRHMTPNEAWESHTQNGFVAVIPDEAESNDLFRPYAVVNCRRGEIQLHSNRYFSRALEQYHGEELQAGYDIRDPQFLWVRDLEGRFIARAEINANSRAYMPQSVIEQAEERREQGRLHRLQNKIDEVLLERNPHAVMEQLEQVSMPGLDLSRELLAKRAEEIAALPVATTDAAWSPRKTLIPETPTNVVSLTETGAQKYARWKGIDARFNQGEMLDETERNFWQLFPESDLFQMLREQEQEEVGLRQQARI